MHCRFEGGRHLVGLVHHLQATAPTAVDRLDRDGQAVFACELDHFGGDPARRDFRAEHADRLRLRPHPHHSRVDHGLSEVGVLGEESVPRMHGVGVCAHGGARHRVDVQVGVGGLGRTQCVRFVGQTHEQRVGIRLRVADYRSASGFVDLMFVTIDEKLVSVGSKVSFSPYTTLTPASPTVLATTSRSDVPYSSLNTAMARFFTPSCTMICPSTTPCTVSGGIVRKK